MGRLEGKLGNNGPEPDRLWWLAAILAVGIPAFGAITVYQLFVLSLRVDQDTAQSSQNTYLTTIGFALLYLALDCYVGLLSRAMYKRAKRRKAALNGDLDAIPLARTTAKAERAPDVSQQPLLLYWRATPKTRFLYRFLAVPLLEFCGFMILGFLALLIVVVVDGLDMLPELITPATLPPFFLLGFLSVGIPFLVWITRGLPTFLGKPYGFTVDEHGLRGRALTGAKRSLAWEDVRLFEIRTGAPDYVIAQGVYYLYYFLYGDKTVITLGANREEFAPDGIGAAEMTSRLRALEDLVLAKTGLAPRTLSPSLQQRASPEPLTPMVP